MLINSIYYSFHLLTIIHVSQTYSGVPNFQRPTGHTFWDKDYSLFQPEYDFKSVMHYRPGNPYGCGEVLTPVVRLIYLFIYLFQFLYKLFFFIVTKKY